MIRFSLHISISESVFEWMIHNPSEEAASRRFMEIQYCKGLFGLLDLLFAEWAGDTFDVTV